MLKNIRIVLVNTSHSGNIGATARAMKNMGLSCLFLVKPKDFPSADAYARASSANDVLDEAIVVNTLSEAVSGCDWVVGTSARDRSMSWKQMEPSECAVECVSRSKTGDIAVIFGNERTGLTNEEMELCNAFTSIPTSSEYSSLNVAAAVMLMCYEFRINSLEINDNNETLQLDTDDRPATAEQMENLFNHFNQALDDLNFYGSSNPEMIMRRIKNLFNRAEVTKREVNILRGILSAAQGRKSAR